MPWFLHIEPSTIIPNAIRSTKNILDILSGEDEEYSTPTSSGSISVQDDTKVSVISRQDNLTMAKQLLTEPTNDENSVNQLSVQKENSKRLVDVTFKETVFGFLILNLDNCPGEVTTWLLGFTYNFCILFIFLCNNDTTFTWIGHVF